MNILQQVVRYFRVYQKYIGRRLYVVFFLSLFATLTEGLGIMMLLPLIDASGFGGSEQLATQTKIGSFLYDILVFFGIGSSMVGILLFIVIVIYVKGVIHFLALSYQAYLQTQLMLEVKTSLFKKYNSMDYNHYVKHNTGHYVNVINTQSGQMIVSFENYKQFVVSIITALAYFISAFFVAWQFALMALVCGALLLFVFKGMNYKVHMLSRKSVSEFSVLNKLLVQIMQSFKYLLATGQQNHLRNGFLQSAEKLTRYIRKQGLLRAFTTALTEPVAICLVISVIIIQVSILKAPLAPIFVALVLFNRAMGSVMGIQQSWQLTLDKIGGLEMVEEEFRQISGS